MYLFNCTLINNYIIFATKKNFFFDILAKVIKPYSNFQCIIIAVNLYRELILEQKPLKHSHNTRRLLIINNRINNQYAINYILMFMCYLIIRCNTDVK